MLPRVTTFALLIVLGLPAHAQHSWEETKEKGHGTITVYWHESRPFIYKTAMGRMEGIEPEILEAFRKYLKEIHNINLRIEWKEAPDFGRTYTNVRDANQKGIMGASAFSITAERRKEVLFGPSYMFDISVLITSKSIPIVKTVEEFNRVFSKLTAITIKETTYEQDLIRLKKSADISFEIRYIPSSKSILTTVEEMDSAFGFIDLPVYMKRFSSNPSLNVKRQNLFPSKRDGYAFIMPLNSDWIVPLKEYFEHEGFQSELETIIDKYIDIELYHFIEGLAVQSNDPVILLTKEKEIQYMDLIGKARQIEFETRTRNFLILLVTVTFILLIVIIILYSKRSKQKRKIEVQRKRIELKNQQLEKRNLHLMQLDEEKNNLIRILAHDLRTPINHVQGLAQVFLLTNTSLTEEQRKIILDIKDASVRLNKMITSILDSASLKNEKEKICLDDVPICSLVRQIAKTFEKQAENKNIRLSVITCDDHHMIRCDSLFFTQVLENLISNAIKFSEPGKNIEISVHESGDRMLISVKDEGPGFTKADKQLLFREFQRLSAKPTAGESSTGLGLSIVKRYVEMMNGEVWCESEHGEGATFTVSFAKVV